MGNRFISSLLAAAIVGTLSIGPVAVLAADGAVEVNVNLARILRINSPASTVIVGNPGIADVTIQDAQTLILTGRSYGVTNLIVLDPAGNPIVDTMIEVSQGNDDVVTVYQGMAKTSLSCDPDCQPMIMLGDDPSFTANNIASAGLIAQSAN